MSASTTARASTASTAEDARTIGGRHGGRRRGPGDSRRAGAPNGFGDERRARARRAGLVTLAAALAAVGCFVAALLIGSTALDPGRVAASLLGFGDPATDFIVRGLRLPRAATAALVGLALGAAGSVFQRLLRNPLAAPDFIGVSAGASTATVAGLVLFGASGLALSAAAVVGALATAALGYLLAWRGGISGGRFILIGVGIAALCDSATAYLVARAEFSDARAALTWLVGSVGMAGPAELTALGVGVLVLVPLLASRSRRLGILELGEPGARALGLPVQAETALLLGGAIVLTALATAAAGPIAFVALMAGPIANRMLGPAGPRTIAAALVGAVLVQASDLIAQHALPTPISTGIVTGLVGAPYIAWLLIRTERKGTASCAPTTPSTSTGSASATSAARTSSAG